MSYVSPCNSRVHRDDYNSDMYEGTRSANMNDVVSIEQLLRPLEENGVLIHRSREQVSFIKMKPFLLLWNSILDRVWTNVAILSVLYTYGVY